MIESAREVFQAFFQFYPYCYGYWKKFADMERKQGHRERAIAVLEEGVKAISLSVDLWVHYIEFAASCYRDTSQGEERIRRYRPALSLFFFSLFLSFGTTSS